MQRTYVYFDFYLNNKEDFTAIFKIKWLFNTHFAMQLLNFHANLAKWDRVGVSSVVFCNKFQCGCLPAYHRGGWWVH